MSDLRAALREWVGLNAMRWDKYPSGTTVVDAEALDAFLAATPEPTLDAADRPEMEWHEAATFLERTEP